MATLASCSVVVPYLNRDAETLRPRADYPSVSIEQQVTIMQNADEHAGLGVTQTSSTELTAAAGKQLQAGGREDEAPGGATSSVGKPASPSKAGGKTLSKGRGNGADSTDAIALLKSDHRRVEGLFAEYETASPPRKQELVSQICRDLITHTILEEEIFYPACRRAAASDDEPLDEAQVEHDSAKLLIIELLDGRPDDGFRDAQVKVLSEQIKHHVAEEEAAGTGIFAKAQAAGVDTAELGRRIQKRRRRLDEQGGPLRPTRPVSFQQLQNTDSSGEEFDMARHQGPERDERGRFIGDDDDRGSRGGYSSAGSRGGGSREDDDRREGRGRSGWFGDPEGHSMAARSRGESRSYEDDRRDYMGSDDRRRDDEGRYMSRDDDYRASGRQEVGGDGRRGWYGDSRGHAEAARRGWDERGRSSRDDDVGRSSREMSDRERDDHGRFMSHDDDRSYRSRERDDDMNRSRSGDDGDGRGWYGDSRGHAEAARRGWESRGRNEHYDDNRSSGPSDQGHGGWFGDSRGHAEASRRGWEHRR
ncbi:MULTISPECIES: hemerythrin domain-containing protein [unclassified Brevundimonas]|uniref:hemerythrin domain-containing protein n=1 Tax=unclassified Brevundimonas TaxID=2622653 RepID=UPI003F8D98E3